MSNKNSKRPVRQSSETNSKGKHRFIDFLKLRTMMMMISGLLILGSIASLVTKGLNLGIDFTGGTVIELGYPTPANVDEIRNLLQADGHDASVQNFGSAQEILIRLAPSKDEKTAKEKAQLSDNIITKLQEKTPGIEKRRVEFVGPQIGEELREQGGIAMLLALAGILIYVTLRFEFRFSVGSILALVHDIIITVGFFSITGIQFDLTILAAVLAIIGYSLNDTIVIFDRIRENFLKLRKVTNVESINTSINETLSRTLVTSLTTLLVLLSLFFFGGEIIHGFSIAMIVGIIIGTYSSIYVASSSLLAMGVTREALLPPEKEETDDYQQEEML